MVPPVQPISMPAMADPAAVGPSSESGVDFAGVFADAVQSVNGVGQEAATTVERFLSGDGEDLHTAVLATTRAELAFDLFLETRNKVVSAYQEIMRMQL